MGCNCKKKAEYIDKKYGDNELSAKVEMNILTRIMTFIGQFLFGILAGVIVIIMVIPMLVYLIFCMMFGLEPHFKLYNLAKRLNKNGKGTKDISHKD